MQCIALMEPPNDDATEEEIAQKLAIADNAKMELIKQNKVLMPKGVPDFLSIVKYPTIEQLIAQHGENNLSKVIFLLVKDFCNSLNVVRNMTEVQMFEATTMLVDECGNFRLEDYVMMFTLAKRGQLVKILDRVDIQVFGLMLDEYHKIRYAAGERYFEQQQIEQKNLLYQKALPANSEEEKKVEIMWHEMVQKMNREYLEQKRKLQEEQFQKQKAQWEKQAESVGINVNEILKAFGKRKHKITQTEQKVLDVYAILKFKAGSLQNLAELLNTDMRQIIKISNLEIKDERILCEFIKQGEIIISEMNQKGL